MGSTVVESPCHRAFGARRPIPLAGLTAWAAPAPHFPPYTFRPRASPALSSYTSHVQTEVVSHHHLLLLLLLFLLLLLLVISSGGRSARMGKEQFLERV